MRKYTCKEVREDMMIIFKGNKINKSVEDVKKFISNHYLCSKWTVETLANEFSVGGKK